MSKSKENEKNMDIGPRRRFNYSSKRILILLLFMSLLVLTLNLKFAYGQPPTPPSPEVSWNPPNEGSPGGQSHYDMAGWSSTYTLIAWTADVQGNPKSTFDMGEGVYLYVDTPVNWLENRIWLYEYYQSNTSSGRWIFWMRLIGPGRFRFGPFYPDDSNPTGNFTWRVWILNLEKGGYQDQVLSTYIIPEFQNPILVFVIGLFLVSFIFLKKMQQI